MRTITDFLSKFPDKWFLLLVWLIVFFAWYATKHDFLAQLVRDLTMAILTLLGVRKAVSQDPPTTNIENIEQAAVKMERPAEQVNSQIKNKGEQKDELENTN